MRDVLSVIGSAGAKPTKELDFIPRISLLHGVFLLCDVPTS